MNEPRRTISDCEGAIRACRTSRVKVLLCGVGLLATLLIAAVTWASVTNKRVTTTEERVKAVQEDVSELNTEIRDGFAAVLHRLDE